MTLNGRKIIKKTVNPKGHCFTFSEVALEPPRNMTEIPHSPCSSGLPSDCLHTPIV